MKNDWDQVITPGRGLLELPLKEIWYYRDLLLLLIRRDIVVVYKQTILGPVWYFVQPLLTMLVYIVVFGNIAKIPTDNLPQPLFYLSGIVVWNYFQESLLQTSDVFHKNSALFSKIYFPRVIIPLTKVVSALLQLFIQSLLLLAIIVYYKSAGIDIKIANIGAIIIPYLILAMAGIGLGMGLILSSLTAKYRDLKFLITTGVQLLMYATPVIYPMSLVPDDYRQLIAWNPVAHIVEAFKYCVLGTGEFSYTAMAYVAACSVALLFLGLILFNKTEKTFVDTV